LVLSLLHYAPSAAAAVLTIFLAMKGHSSTHKLISYTAAGSALLGLVGFAIEIDSNLFDLGFHSIHAWIGALTLVSSLGAFAIRRRGSSLHCLVGRLAGVLAVISLVMGVIILLGMVPIPDTSRTGGQIPTSSRLPEIEASSFMNQTLLPIAQQGNNAIAGTQVIERGAYRLTVSGLVERNVTLTYDELLQLPAYTEVAYMPCVEGWGFYAKWTGFRVTDLINEAGVKPEGQYVMFRSVDGYSTALPLSYLEKNQTLLAYGLNDVTLPVDRGFPLQLVAKSKYGYKWAKWITEIEVIPGPELGYWESRGYIDSADVGAYPFS
jgi:hypothetical protein